MKSVVLKRSLALCMSIVIVLCVLSIIPNQKAVAMTNEMLCEQIVAAEGVTTQLTTGEVGIEERIIPENPVVPTKATDKWNGDYVYYGKWNNKDLKWRVLQNDGENLLLMTDSSVRELPYRDVNSFAGSYSDTSDNIYANSTIREWLNDTFFLTAFSEEEQEELLINEVENGYSSTSIYDSGPNTQDKVYVLSFKDFYNSSYGFWKKNENSASRIFWSENIYGDMYAEMVWTRTMYEIAKYAGSPFAVWVNKNGGFSSRGSFYKDPVTWSKHIHPVIKVPLTSLNWKNYSDDENTTGNNSVESVTVTGSTAGQASSKLKIGNKVEFTVPEDIPLVGGGDVELDFSVIPVQYEQIGNTYKIGIGVKDIKKFGEDDWLDLKKLVETQNEEYKKGINTLLASKFGTASMGWTVKPKITCYGYAEGVITEDGVQSCEGKMMLEIKVKANNEWQTTIVVVPVVIKLSGEVGIKATLSMGLDFENGYVYTRGKVDLALPKIKLSTGIGVAHIADVSVYGSVNNNITLAEDITSNGQWVQSVTASLEGEAGVSAKLLFASYEKALWTGSKEYYNSEDSVEVESLSMVKSSILPDELSEYAINRNASTWNTNQQSTAQTWNLTSSPINTLVADVYSAADPILVRTDEGKQILIHVSDVASRITGNHTAITYSIYDDESQSWSNPIIIDDDGTADFYPSVAVDDERVVVTWSNCKKEFTETEIETETFLTDVGASCEIEVAVIDTTTGEITSEQLTDDECTDVHSSVMVADGDVYVTWYKNQDNDVIHLGGTNEICVAHQDTDWKISTLAEIDQSLADIAIGELQGSPTIVYITNNSENQETVTSNDLFVVNVDGEIIYSMDNIICQNPQFTYMNDQATLMWYMSTENGSNISYITGGEDVCSNLLEDENDVTSDYCMISGTDECLLLYSAIDESKDGKNLNAYYMKEGIVHQSIVLTDVEEYIMNPTGVCINDTYKMAFLKKNAQITGEELVETADLCTLDLGMESDLEIVDIDYDAETMLPGNVTELKVTIKNNGLKDSAERCIQILDDAEVIGNITLTDNLAVGKTCEYAVSLTLPSDMEISDSYIVQLVSDDSVTEQTIEVGFVDVALTTEMTTDGYIATISNESGFATEVMLVIYDKEVDGTELARYEIGTLESGESIEKEFSKEELAELGECLCFSVMTTDDSEELFSCNNNSYLYVGEDIVQALDHLEATKDKVTYEIGEALSLDDMSVVAVYENDTTKEIVDYATNADEIDMSKIGKKTLTITYEENYIVRTVSFTIKVVQGSEDDVEEEEDGNENVGSSVMEKDTSKNQNLSQEDNATYPKVGVQKILSTGVYKVTKSSADIREVTFMKPKNSKKTSVSIPATVEIDGYTYNVTEIASKAFKNNKKLKSVTIGKNVKKIGKEAFSGCKNLQKVTIGKNVTTIATKAFYNCTKLKKITIKSSVLKSVGKNAIKNINKKATIKVPKKKLKSYKKLFKSKTGYKKTMKIKK